MQDKWLGAYFLMSKFRQMRYTLYILLFLGASVLQLAARPVDRQTALQQARHWWNRSSRASVTDDSLTIELHPRSVAYCCRRSDEFVLIAADDRLPSILGYGRMVPGAVCPPALSALLRMPLLRAAYPPMGAQWQPVRPLLTTVRHQSAPYNTYCPIYRYDNGEYHDEPCLVGCVATAMEQILTYYRRTYRVAETIKGWETPHYVVHDIPAGVCVDTRLIRDNYDVGQTTAEEREAVARLSYYLGQACQMDWGVSASGAESQLMAEGVKRYFGLGYVQYLDSYLYAPTAYWNFIAAELAARRPVYYAGSIMRTGGHAFVLDGIDENGMFHVNWGYGGSYDGYFRLDILAHPQPEGDRLDDYVETGFFCNQQAIAVHPDQVTDAFVPLPLDRRPDDVRVESLSFGATPVSGCSTPVRLCLYNASSQPLTTPFALLENEPADTNRVEQARWLAMTGRTLQPGERDTACVHLRWSRSGNLLLSVTPNGKDLIYTLPVHVGTGGTEAIDPSEPVILSLTPDRAVFSQHYLNASSTERAARRFIYDLLDTETRTESQIERIIYVAPQSETTDTVCFKGLCPGRRYTLRLRSEWPIVRTLDFTLPDESVVHTPEISDAEAPVQWYTIAGCPVSSPVVPGVYLRRQGNEVKKIMISIYR